MMRTNLRYLHLRCCLFLLFSACLACLLLAGCGGDSDSDENTGTNPDWTYSFTAGPGSSVYLSAALLDVRASIRVLIFVNGTEFKNQLSWGQNVSATVFGTLGTEQSYSVRYEVVSDVAEYVSITYDDENGDRVTLPRERLSSR